MFTAGTLEIIRSEKKESLKNDSKMSLNTGAITPLFPSLNFTNVILHSSFNTLND
ncbi:MAG TPA: hypothetical protein VIM16_01840 [Mucilaginibacter sp.]